MAVMAREAWTDERLDDLQKHMDEGFHEVRAELRVQRQEMAQQKHVDARFDTQQGHMDARFDALMRTIQIGFSVIGVLIAALMTLVGIWL